MSSFRTIPLILVAAIMLAIACGDDNSVVDGNKEILNPPADLYGFPVETQDATEIVFMWMPSTTRDIDGYNQYLKIGDGEFIKINNTVVVGRGGIPGNRPLSEHCDHVRIVIEIHSTELHTYYMTTVKDSLESAPSNMVRFTPSLIDLDQTIEIHGPYIFDSNIGCYPSFSWVPVENGVSYVISLYESSDTAGDNWTFRLNDTTCLYGSHEGTTYLDVLGDSLNYCTSYDYGIMALDENNFCIASNEALFATKCEVGLRGLYSGKYTVIRNIGNDISMTTDWQYIDWTFTDQKFFCAANTDEQPAFTCNFSGNYRFTNVVELLDTLVAPGSCNHADIPAGDFTVTFYPSFADPDSLILQQLISTTLKKITLIPVPE